MYPNIPDINSIDVQTDDDQTSVLLELGDGAFDDNTAATHIWVGTDLPFGMDGWIEIQPRRAGSPTVHQTIQYAKIDSSQTPERVALDHVIPLLLDAETVGDLQDSIVSRAIADQLERTAENTAGLETGL